MSGLTFTDDRLYIPTLHIGPWCMGQLALNPRLPLSTAYILLGCSMVCTTSVVFINSLGGQLISINYAHITVVSNNSAHGLITQTRHFPKEYALP